MALNNMINKIKNKTTGSSSPSQNESRNKTSPGRQGQEQEQRFNILPHPAVRRKYGASSPPKSLLLIQLFVSTTIRKRMTPQISPQTISNKYALVSAATRMQRGQLITLHQVRTSRARSGGQASSNQRSVSSHFYLAVHLLTHIFFILFLYIYIMNHN